MSRLPAKDRRREIPAVGRLLADPVISSLCENRPRVLVVGAIRTVLKRGRLKSEPLDNGLNWIGEICEEVNRLSQPSLSPVINGTGVILHTNLGRAPIAREALGRAVDVAAGYSNLEYDIQTGKRGSRYDHCTKALREATGAQDALVVNNNAAAVVLALHSMANGREVIVSRGELVEIGGSFRIPEIMEASGARLKEVGTTNRTRLSDYEKAITKETALILKVHPSNYRVQGFTEEVGLLDLVRLGKRRRLPVMIDLGTALLRPLTNMNCENLVARDLVKIGADIVTFSGDKLLSGPQAGILLGKKKAITAMRNDPWLRILRVDKLTLALLEAVIRSEKPSPVEEMFSRSQTELKGKAGQLAAELADLAPKWRIEVVASESMAGGGSLPEEAIESVALSIDGEGNKMSHFETALRLGNPSVIALLRKNRVLIDMRTIQDNEFALLSSAIRVAAKMTEKGSRQ